MTSEYTHQLRSFVFQHSHLNKLIVTDCIRSDQILGALLRSKQPTKGHWRTFNANEHTWLDDIRLFLTLSEHNIPWAEMSDNEMGDLMCFST